MVDVLRRWLRDPIGAMASASTVAFGAPAAADGAISWWVAVLITLGVAVLPPLLVFGWSEFEPTRWSPQAATAAIVSAALVFVITSFSVAAGALALGLTVVAYVGGRWSN